MKIKLSNRALLKVSGEGAMTFLQGQLSNDISLIKDDEVQFNAYCTHQGKVIALFRTFKINGDFFLDFPKDLLEIVQKRLQMFIMMSKVVLEEVSTNFICTYIVDEDINDTTNVFKLNIIGFLAFYAKDTKIENLIENENIYLENMIKAKIPEIELVTTEKFVPQMLDLDLDNVNGVNFKKGCYAGQEVVARLHYLGKAKRRLLKFKTDVKDVVVGDKLFSHTSQSAKKSGIIVAVINNESGSLCLASFELSQQQEAIYLNDAQGAIMEILR